MSSISQMELSFNFKISDNLVDTMVNHEERQAIRRERQTLRERRIRADANRRCINRVKDCQWPPERMVNREPMFINPSCPIHSKCEQEVKEEVDEKKAEEEVKEEKKEEDEDETLTDYLSAFTTDPITRAIWEKLGPLVILHLLKNADVDVDKITPYSLYFKLLGFHFPMLMPISDGIDMYVNSKPDVELSKYRLHPQEEDQPKTNVATITDANSDSESEVDDDSVKVVVSNDQEDRIEPVSDDTLVNKTLEELFSNTSKLDETLVNTVGAENLELVRGLLNNPDTQNILRNILTGHTQGKDTTAGILDLSNLLVTGVMGPEFNIQPEHLTRLSSIMSSMDPGSLDVPKPSEDVDV